eukprot:m.393263 g.393263  ORF g.393263 m.393263 type:complete len:205 (-) comp16765_c0_seq21:88-702(-)
MSCVGTGSYPPLSLESRYLEDDHCPYSSALSIRCCANRLFTRGNPKMSQHSGPKMLEENEFEDEFEDEPAEVKIKYGKKNTGEGSKFHIMDGGRSLCNLIQEGEVLGEETTKEVEKEKVCKFCLGEIEVKPVVLLAHEPYVNAPADVEVADPSDGDAPVPPREFGGETDPVVRAIEERLRLMAGSDSGGQATELWSRFKVVMGM